MLHISNDLKNKIRQTMTDDGKLIFNNDESDIYNECKMWDNFIYNTPFDFSTKDYKLNIGRFYGIFPTSIGCNCVTFSIDVHKKPSWKDWFIIEGVGA